MSNICSFAILIGRILISFFFIWSGVTKLVAYHETLPIFESLSVLQGLEPQVHSWVMVAFCAIQILGGLLILIGCKARFGALLLILLMVPATIVFHNFWTLSGAAMLAERHMFLENLAIIGGLFYVLAVGAGHWGWGCDHRLCCHTKENQVK